MSITLLECEMSAIVWWFEHSLALIFFGIEMKTDLFQSLWPLLSFPNLLLFKTSLIVSHNLSNMNYCGKEGSIIRIYWKGTHFKNIEVESIHGRIKDHQHYFGPISKPYFFLVMSTCAWKTT